jgi:predicted amidohydrolase YtcJ
LTGGNWDHEQWLPPYLPQKELIDPYTLTNLVFATRLDLHMGLANSSALKLAGILKDTAMEPCFPK